MIPLKVNEQQMIIHNLSLWGTKNLFSKHNCTTNFIKRLLFKGKLNKYSYTSKDLLVQGKQCEACCSKWRWQGVYPFLFIFSWLESSRQKQRRSSSSGCDLFPCGWLAGAVLCGSIWAQLFVSMTCNEFAKNFRLDWIRIADCTFGPQKCYNDIKKRHKRHNVLI